MTTPSDPQWQGQQPAPDDYPTPPQGSYPPPAQGGNPLGQFAAPAGVPVAVQNAYLCWTALAGLVLLSFVINLAMSIGSGGAVSGLLGVGLAVGAAYGAREMRAGKRSGRIIAAVCGGILGLFQLLGLLFILTLASGGAAVIAVVVVGVALALVVAGMLFMFRPEVSAFLVR